MLKPILKKMKNNPSFYDRIQEENLTNQMNSTVKYLDTKLSKKFKVGTSFCDSHTYMTKYKMSYDDYYTSTTMSFVQKRQFSNTLNNTQRFNSSILKNEVHNLVDERDSYLLEDTTQNQINFDRTQTNVFESILVVFKFRNH